MTYGEYMNFARVDETICAGSLPNSVADLKTIADNGCQYVVSLTRASLIGRGDITANSLQFFFKGWLHAPAIDGAVPPNMPEILDFIDHAQANHESVFLHCRWGLGRTGTTMLAWYKRHGLAVPEIIEKWQRAKPNAWVYNQLAVPYNTDQRAYITDVLGYSGLW